MTLFEQIISEITFSTPELRQGRAQSIIDAINKLRKVRITYDDEQGGKGKNERTIIPIAFGIDKRNGKPSVRAYQIGWSSKRGFNRPTNDAAAKKTPSYWRERPHWKLFIVDRIGNWSTEPRKASQSDIEAIKADGLNTNGDSFFSTYFAVSPLCNQSTYNIENWYDTEKDKEIGPNPVEKSQITAQPEPEIQNNEKGVDNYPNASYITNKPSKLNAPETTPITKADITGVDNAQQNGEENNSVENPIVKPTNTIDHITDEPITKDQINPKDSEFARTFTDLTNRMDDLYRDEEKDEEEWH